MAEDLVSYFKGLKAQGIPRDQWRQMGADFLAKQGGGAEPDPAAPSLPRPAGPHAEGYQGAEMMPKAPTISAADTGLGSAAEAMAPGITRFTARTGDPREGAPSRSGLMGLLDHLPITGPMNGLWQPQVKSGAEGQAESDAAGAQLAQGQQEHPGAAIAGSVLGGLGSVGSRVGGGLGALGAGAGAAGRIGMAALGGAAGGATDAGMRTSVDPRAGLGDIAQAAGVGGVEGGIGGGLFGTAIEGVGAAARGLGNTVGGMAKKLVDKYKPDLAGLSPTDAEIGTLSNQGATNILKGRDAKFRAEVMDPHVAEKAQIAVGRGGELAPPDEVAAIYEEMQRALSSGKLTGGEALTVDGLKGELVARAAGHHGGGDVHVDENGSPLFQPITHEKLNNLRQKYGRVAKTGAQGQGVGQAEMEGIRKAAKAAVDQGPYAETNARFHEGKVGYEQDRNLLNLPKDAPTNPKIATEDGLQAQEVEKLANQLARQRQNTVTSKLKQGNADDLATFAERNPEFTKDVELPGALAAKGDLQFRIPGQASQHGGLINRLPTGLATAAALPGYMLDPKLGVGLGLLGAIGANVDPITGRILYPLAQGAARAAQALPEGAAGAVGAAAAPQFDDLRYHLGLLPTLDEMKKGQRR